MCDKKWIHMTTGNYQLSGWTEKKLQSTSQSQTCTKKKGHGYCLVVWSTSAFRILVKPLHLRSMLSKWMRCTKNWDACSQHWSTEWAQFFSKTTSDCTSYNQHFKSWTNWAMKFCLISHIHLTSRQLATTSSSISTTFCRQNVSTTSRRQKMLSKNPP